MLQVKDSSREREQLRQRIKDQHDNINQLASERELLQKKTQELTSVKQELTSVKQALNEVSAGNNVVATSLILGVSPKSMDKVKKYSSNEGTVSCRDRDDRDEAVSPAEGERNYYLERMGRALTPAIEKLCSIPKFVSAGQDSGGVPDVTRVSKLLLRKLAHTKGKARRKLFKRRPKHRNRPLGVSDDLDKLLKEMATAWRSATRNYERDAAARLLQMTVLAIPKRKVKGRVSEWLGPSYFNEELPVERGSAVRCLSTTNHRVKFRNDYRHSTLGKIPSPSP
jgi:hypothetical protein